MGMYLVSCRKGQAQRVAQSLDHFPAGAGPAGLKKRDMPGRNIRFQSQIKLTEMPGFAPSAKRVRKL